MLLENQKQSKYGYWLPAFLFVFLAVLTTLLVLGVEPRFYFTLSLQCWFGLMEITTCIQLWYLVQRPIEPHVKRLLSMGLTLFICACCAWATDIMACGHLHSLIVNPQLHAIWHVVMSCAIYCANVGVSLSSENILGNDASLGFFLGFIPFVQIHRQNPKSH